MRKTWLLFSTLYIIGCGTSNRSASSSSIVKDSSYSIAAEYAKNIGKYPFIQIPAQVSADSFKQIKGINYGKAGKRVLSLNAYLPVEKKSKTPALIFIHGGGWRSGNPQMHEAFAQRLAVKGIACFLPEYRLSTEAKFPAAIEDIIQSINWVKKKAKEYNLDTRAIFIGGHSAGGELAAYIGAKYSSTLNLAGIINADGIVAFIHPESGEGDDSKRISAATQWFGYSKMENPGLWKEGSPITYAGPTTPPVLFINSGVARMHAGRDDMVKILSAHGIVTEIENYDTAPHSFILFDPWLNHVVSRIVKFMQSITANRDAIER